MGKLIINLYLTPSLNLNRSPRKKQKVNVVQLINRMRKLKTDIKRERSVYIKKVKVRVKAKQKYTELLPST